MNHASHGYFADRYGLEVVGTVIPGVGTGATPTARELSDLTAAIRTSGAKAVFVEIDENPELARQIADETGATVVTDLLDHSLSEPGGVAPTYIDMLKYDTRRIVEALR
jgi:ABC-type Zn uptake system ZnuABC Zn-binding protein ZnuA